MYILDYLFYKYYWLQVRIGNRDVAIFYTISIITMLIFLYIATIFMIVIYFFITNVQFRIIPFYGLIGGFLIFLFLSYSFLYKKRYKKIIINDKYKRKSNFIAIIIPIFIFCLLNVVWILKMLQNQGKL